MEEVMVERMEKVSKILKRYNLSELVNLLIKNLQTYGSELNLTKVEQDWQVNIQIKSKIEDVVTDNELKFVKIEIIDELNEVMYKIKLIYEDDKLVYVKV